MIESSVKLFRIGITFNPNAIRTGGELFIFSGEDIVDKTITVPSGLSLISFTLSTISSFEPATFPTYPLQWFDGDGNPISAPSWFTYHWVTPSHFTLLDFNSAIQEIPHPFNIVVAYQGLTYGSDPIIVNEPPMPVG